MPFTPFHMGQEYLLKRFANDLLGVILVSTLHLACIYSALVGEAVYFAINRLLKFNNSRKKDVA